ncbi:hypothetical protein MXB_4381, partial [Myxobolus squamalis]
MQQTHTYRLIVNDHHWTKNCTKLKPDKNTFDLSTGTGNYIILNPLNCISITGVANATKCIRQAYLYILLPSATVASLPMIVGSVGHYLFEFALTSSLNDTRQPIQITREILKQKAIMFLNSENSVQQLFSADISAESVLQKLEDYYDPIIIWSSKILCDTFNPKQSFVLNDCMIKFKVIALEEYFEDDIYGFKGNLFFPSTIFLSSVS